MGMDVNQNFDYEVGDDLTLGLLNNLDPLVGSISTPITSTPFKNFITPSFLDLDATVIWELFKAHLRNFRSLTTSSLYFNIFL